MSLAVKNVKNDPELTPPARVSERLIAPRGRHSLRAAGATVANGTTDRASCWTNSIGWLVCGSGTVNRDRAGETTRISVSGEKRANALVW